MNLNYLLSIIDLYLLKEIDDHLVINVYNSDIIKLECFYASSSLNKTYVKIDKNVFFDNINYILKKIQGNLNIKNESYENDDYKVIFDNNRQIEFINFNSDVLSKIRDNLSNKDKFELINENTSEEIKKINNEVKQGNINNFVYLLKLNYLASRTYNELNQYPVFPWIFFDMDKIDSLLNIEKNNINAIEKTLIHSYA